MWWDRDADFPGTSKVNLLPGKYGLEEKTPITHVTKGNIESSTDFNVSAIKSASNGGAGITLMQCDCHIAYNNEIISPLCTQVSRILTEGLILKIQVGKTI